MDAPAWTADDDRDGLTQRRPTGWAKQAPTCNGCGFVVYAVGVRLPYRGVLCKPCAEQAEREPEPGEAFRGLVEQQQIAMKVKR